MNIGMMGGWNTDSGASFHAELIGRAWVKLGHKLTVFTFYPYAFHGTQIIGKDEDYVIRCFTVFSYPEQKLDPVPFLTTDYEIFVVQDLCMLPKDLLAKIFHRIKKRAKTINVIHDGKLSSEPAFYQFEWDAIVCFDERYRKFLLPAYKEEKIYIIPYPCIEPRLGDKLKAREKLGLPKDKKILFSFGPASKYVYELLPAINDLGKNYNILLLIVTKMKETIKKLKLTTKKNFEIKIIQAAPPIDELYDYLHAADALIFNKPSPAHVVVSSTAFQCLGSGCPIVAKSSVFTEYFEDEVFKYSDKKSFKSCIISIFEQDKHYIKVHNSAIAYADKNSAINIAKKYIELFKNV